jgi:hypothetical protein
VPLRRAALFERERAVTVAIMEVPCCSGLLKMVLEARESAEKKPIVETVIVGVEGSILVR